MSNGISKGSVPYWNMGEKNSNMTLGANESYWYSATVSENAHRMFGNCISKCYGLGIFQPCNEYIFFSPFIYYWEKLSDGLFHWCPCPCLFFLYSSQHCYLTMQNKLHLSWWYTEAILLSKNFHLSLPSPLRCRAGNDRMIGFIYILVHFSLNGSPREHNSQDKITKLWLLQMA